MADEFERFLASALAPEQRDADRRFVARVQARIALDERMRAGRKAAVRQLLSEVLALAAVAAALLWLSRAARVGEFFSDSPAAALGALLTAFALLAVLFSSQKVTKVAAKSSN